MRVKFSRADRYRELFEHLPVGIYQTTPAGAFLDANPTLVEMLGYDNWDELRHVNTVNLYVDPRDRLRWRSAMERDGRVTDFEVQKRKKDGGIIWLRDNARAVMNSQGGVKYYEGAVIDVTDQRTAEQRARALLSAMPDCMLRFGRDGRCLDADISNPEQAGLDTANPAGRSVAELFPKEQAPAIEDAIESALSRRSKSTIEYARSATGTDARVYEARILPCGSEDALLLVRNVTDQKRMQASLVQSERMASVGFLAAGVAHEINNPLSYLTTNVEFADRVLTQCVQALESDQATAEAAAEARTALEETLTGIARVAQVVGDLKTFSRPDSVGSATAEPRAAIEAAIAIAQNEIRHRARLVREFQPTENVAIGSQRLVQVLVNLLLHASQTITEGDTEKNQIVVSLTQANSESVEIAIADTGVGISPEAIGRVFEPFFSTNPTEPRTGLGLAVCHGIVTHAGGRIDVESQVGRGSTFRLRLPIAEAVRATSKAAQPISVPPPRKAGILVIDDEPLIGRALKRSLRGDHDVTVARDAREALTLLLQGLSFDLILCDVMMPGMSGVDFHVALNQYRPELVKKVVFITGGAFTPRAEQFLETVANRRLTKPIAEQTLRKLIAELSSDD